MACLTFVERALATALFALGLSGCAAQLTEQSRLAQATAEADHERLRAAELEARLTRVEGELARHQRAASTADVVMLTKLDQLIDLNRELAQRTAEPIESTLTSSSTRAAASTSAAELAEQSCGEGTAEERLERLVRHLHGQGTGWRNGLSAEQSQALRVLLRRRRELDSSPLNW